MDTAEIYERTSTCPCRWLGFPTLQAVYFNTLPHFRQNRDHIDCRHIDYLALHKVQAMQLAKSMMTHNSQFGLCNEQHWVQSNMTAVCPRLFEILTSLTFGALRQKTHHVTDIRGHHKKTKNSTSTCGQQCTMKCQEHNISKTGTLREKNKIRRP